MNKEKIDKIKSSKPFSMLDILVIGLSLIACLTIVLVTCSTRKLGSTVTITQLNSGKSQTYALSGNRTITVDTDSGTLTVCIEDGSAHVESSDCTGQDCVYMGKIRYNGQRIICAQLRVRIAVLGGDGVINAQT